MSHTEISEKKNEYKISFPNYDFVKLKNYCFKQECPFVIYGDFELQLKPCENLRGINTFAYQHHKAYRCGYHFKCSYDENLSYYKSRGDDCVQWFVDEMTKIAKFVEPKFINILPMTEKLSSIGVTKCYV